MRVFIDSMMIPTFSSRTRCGFFIDKSTSEGVKFVTLGMFSFYGVHSNKRKQQAKTILETPNMITQTDTQTFKVKSMSTPYKYYTVSRTGNGLVCSYPDKQFRKSDCKHIHVILNIVKQNKGYANNEFKIMERAKLNLCKYCSSGSLKKDGYRITKQGKTQHFKCLECQKRFTANFGFEKTRVQESTITGAMQMYFTGMSVRDIANHYEMMGIKINASSVYRWIAKYSRMVEKYLNEIIPRTADRAWVRADEVWLKVSGQKKYLFASIDDQTRYFLAYDMADTKFQHNADRLLELTKNAIGKSPKHFTTDGLPAYAKSSKRVFGKDTEHHSHIHLRKDRNNNKMERFNDTFRDRELAFRGLKRSDTPLIDGYQAFYNYTKKHIGLGGKTPAEASNIKVAGLNKWQTLIQNVSLHMYE